MTAILNRGNSAERQKEIIEKANKTYGIAYENYLNEYKQLFKNGEKESFDVKVYLDTYYKNPMNEKLANFILDQGWIEDKTKSYLGDFTDKDKQVAEELDELPPHLQLFENWLPDIEKSIIALGTHVEQLINRFR